MGFNSAFKGLNNELRPTYAIHRYVWLQITDTAEIRCEKHIDIAISIFIDVKKFYRNK